jgi:predicted TIM-barrel fold metal-dependent hydrolase
MHPNTATLIPGLMPQAIEFPFDTVRTITSLVLAGTLARFPSVKLIFSHGGGALPFLAARIAYVCDRVDGVKKNNPRGVEHELRRLYCDTAFASSAPQLAAMLTFLPGSNILYGSDYPFAELEHGVEELDDYPLSQSTRAAIDAENAFALFPRLKSTEASAA